MLKEDTWLLHLKLGWVVKIVVEKPKRKEEKKEKKVFFSV